MESTPCGLERSPGDAEGPSPPVFGLRSTRGSYKNMASMLQLREKDYRRFMDFLRRNDCLLDFRPYRKAAAAQ
jgi:hypothetical protein